MKTRTYTLKGGDVPVSLQGATITFRVPETLQDVQALAKSEADLIELAGSAFDVWLQGRLRAKAAQEGATQASLNDFAATVQYQRRVEGAGSGGSKPKTAKGIATSKAAGAGNRLFEKCASDKDLLARMVKQGFVDQGEFDEWQTAKQAIQSGNGSQTGTQASASKQAPAKAGRK